MSLSVTQVPAATTADVDLIVAVKKNNQGMTPLDYALHYKHSEVTLTMVMHPSRYMHSPTLALLTLTPLTTRGSEILSMETKNYGSLIEGLIVNMPDVMMVSRVSPVTR